jgi:acyl transferase domain-containing protein/NADP-dependent 3-hydroxy acid dehydrogenase YdfG
MPRDEPVAIVGVGALFPGSSDADGFWRDVVAGRDLMRDVPPTHWSLDDYYSPDPQAADHTYGRRGAFLDAVDFDPMEFGIPPAILPATDSAQLLALVVARQVLDDASRGRFAGENRDRISVILGVASATELVAHMAGRLQIPVWQRLLKDAGLEPGQSDALVERARHAYAPWQESTFPGLLGNVVAGRIANRFDLGGTNCVVDAACASSLAAVQMALGELHLGHSDLVITGGVDALNDVFMYMCFSQSTALSTSGDCRPFSDQADGTMLGEGLGMVALKRLAEAERDGDPIYAVIRGLGTSSDGRARSIYAPRAEGQVHALRRCYERAGYGPSTVELVEAHGTATAAGDAAEVEALRTVFDADGRKGRQWCALGSVKSQIGHTKAAAGVAGLLKAALALHHGVLPPTLKVARANPALDLPASPFYLNTAARPWIRGGDHPRRASVSSFGFGGTNFHVALEEYTGPAPRAWRTRALASELFPLAAADPAALAAECERVAQAALGARVLGHLARRVQSEWDGSRPSRLAVVSGEVAELSATLRACAAALREGRPLPSGVAHGAGPALGDVAFLFPGQGSQYVGMGAELAMAFECARAVWDRAAGVWPGEGPRLHHLVFPPPVPTDDERQAQLQRLTATEWAQPAVGAHSLALLAVLGALGVRPACAGGHSFGEVTALCAAGVLDEADALRSARVRGELMAQARGPGAMIAVAAAPESLRERVPDWPGPVAVANHNGPAQTVLSGPLPAIEEMERRLAAAGCASVRLPVSGAFHSTLMEPAVGPFRAHLDALRLRPPAFPVYSNIAAACYAPDAEAVRRGLTAQLTSPVRFAEQLESMYAAGARIFVEVGPQDVLTRLVGQNLKGRPHLAVGLDRARVSGVTALWQGIGALAAAGVPLDFAPLWEGWRPEPEARAGQGPRFTVPISGANYGKPRPDSVPPAAPRPAPPPPPPMPAATAMPAPAPGRLPQRPPVLAPPAAEGADWLRSVEAIQRAAAEAHETYQRTLTESHGAFLAFAEQSMAVLAGGVPVAAARASAAPAPVVAPVASPAPDPRAAEVATPAPPPVAAVPAAPAPAQAEPLDPAAALLEIVAEHTGYPQDMLQLHMDLEADLGIDSIKRVEILAALEERWPGLSLGTERIAAVRTLADVVGTVKGALAASGAPGADSSASSAAPAAAPAASAATAPAAGAKMQRVAIRVAPRPVSEALGLPALRTARRVVVIGGGALAGRIAARLAERGRPADVVEAIPADAEAVIALHGLEPVACIEDALVLDKAMLVTTRAFARAIGDRAGAFVAVQNAGGDFGHGGDSPLRAWAGGFGALVKTLAQELPAVGVKALDVALPATDPDVLAARIVDEIWSGGPEVEVGIRPSGERVVLVEEPAELPGQDGPALAAGAVVVASGGARGVTAAALLALARRAPVRLALLGRSPLSEGDAKLAAAPDAAALRSLLLAQARDAGLSPSPRALDARIQEVLAGREARATLAALAALGAEARYVQADVRDAAAVGAALAEVRRDWGPISAVVHGAGALADALLRDKSDEAFARVLDTKLLGLHALLEATREDPLTHLVLFSSIAARAGNPGQGDYALANAVLAQVAAAEARRRGPACRVRALLWGPWAGGMVTEAVAARMRARGVPLLDVAMGAEAFAREMSSAPGGDVAVVLAAGADPAHPSPPGRPPITMEMDPHRHPYLSSHLINGRPVLPLALVLEWFCRHLRAEGVDGRSLLCRDLRVLRGVPLENGIGAHLHVRSEEAGAEQRLVLLDGEGQGRFQARLAWGGPGLPATDGFGPAGAGGAAWGRDRIYGDGGALSYGPAFQVIEEVDGLGDDRAAARVRGTAEMDWPEGPWATDGAAVEACLQLAVLWAAEAHGLAVLPMRIEEYEQYAAAAGPGPLRCVLRGRAVGPLTARADVRLFGPDGTPLATLRGIELVARPS